MRSKYRINASLRVEAALRECGKASRVCILSFGTAIRLLCALTRRTLVFRVVNLNTGVSRDNTRSFESITVVMTTVYPKISLLARGVVLERKCCADCLVRQKTQLVKYGRVDAVKSGDTHQLYLGYLLVYNSISHPTG